MKSSALDFADLVARYVQDPDYSHRAWLEDAVVAALARSSTRILVIVAEPGAGKSGVLAGLAQRFPGWLRYFIRADSTTPLSGSDASSFLLRIGHQLAAEHPELFDLEQLEIVVNQRIQAAPGATVVGARIDDLQISPFRKTVVRVQQDVGHLDTHAVGVDIGHAELEPRLMDPAILQYLALFDPAAVLAARDPSGRIVVLIDALDEIATAAGPMSVLDWLETCPELPDNVRVVATSRQLPRLQLLAGARGDALVTLEIDPASAAVTADVHGFATGLLTGADLAASVPAPEAAVAALTRAADGNFAYLTAYARALRAAVADGDAETVEALLSTSHLPSGLASLYGYFVAKMQTDISRLGELDGPTSDAIPAWEGVGRRLLAVLAVAREPVTLEQMADYGAVRAWPSSTADVLRRFVAFLDRVDDRYWLFHASLAEFLLDPRYGTPAGSGPVIDPVETQSRLLRRWRRGARSWAEVDWTTVDDYGLRHVAEHVAAVTPVELSEVICRGLREASLRRFITDLNFDRLIGVAQAHQSEPETASEAIAQLLFPTLVRTALRRSGRRTDPAVLGLLARLGGVVEAVERAELLRAGQHQLACFAAIRANTPADQQDVLGPHAGADRMVTAALLVPGNLSFLTGIERRDCLRQAAAALAPFDLDRALRLLDVSESANERDAVVVAAIEARPSDGEALLDRLTVRRCAAALDLAERTDDPEQRSRLLATASAALGLVEQERRFGQQARLVAAGAASADEYAGGVRALLALEERGMTALADAARSVARIETSHPDLARELRAEIAALPADTSTDWALRAIAEQLAASGERAACRSVVDALLAHYRGLGWYGPADDIARLSVIMEPVDSERAEQLRAEALRLVEDALASGDAFNRGESTAIAAAEALLDTHPDIALAIAERVGGEWISGGTWTMIASREGLLATRGIRIADTDPAAARDLLGRCLSDEVQHLSFGRDDPTLVRGGLFYPAADGAPGEGKAFGRTVNLVTYLTNCVNYWVSARTWRAFEAPIDVLRCMRMPPGTAGAIASWAGVVASAVEHVAHSDLDRAAALVASIVDPCEQAIAVAGLHRACVGAGDARSGRIRGEIDRLIAALPAYLPELPLDEVAQGPILRYLDPSCRARVEVAVTLIETMDESAGSVLLPHERPYLASTLDAQNVWWGAQLQLSDELTGVDWSPAIDWLPTLQDPLQVDLALTHLAAALAYQGDPLMPAALERIQTPWLSLHARLLCALLAPEFDGAAVDAALADTPADLSALHRMVLGGRAIELARDLDVVEDTTVQRLLEWTCLPMDGADPLSLAWGAIYLSYAAADLRPGLLRTAIDATRAIANPYLRPDPLGACLALAVRLDDREVLRDVLVAAVDAGWAVVMDVLRAAIGSLVDEDGIDAVTVLSHSLERAQQVVGPDIGAADGLDGVLGVLDGRAQAWVDWMISAPADPTTHLLSFLTADDLPGMHCVQDTRLKGADPDDDVFRELRGVHCGFTAWMSEADQPIWRLVDIRIRLPDEQAAARYLSLRRDQLSESHPEVAGVSCVGSDCAVFGGTAPVPGTDIWMTSYSYVFRLGATVVKLFAAQGSQAPPGSLTPDVLAVIARRIVQRCKAA